MISDWKEMLGWTLLHFLWQGIVVAGIFALLRILLVKAPPNARYLAACVALALLAAAPIATFYSLWSKKNPLPSPVAMAGALDSKSSIQESELQSAVIEGYPPNLSLADAIHFLKINIQPYLAVFVEVWMGGMIALTCRLALGCHYVVRMRDHGVALPPEEWSARTTKLCERMSIHVSVRFLQSLQTQVPLVIGWLHPVILIPASAITGLPTQHLNSLIFHELAHIRRHDYPVNLLQCLLETVFFYHPAVWWISQIIREEREMCCDELAAQASGNRAIYAEALAGMETLRQNSMSLALAANNGPLLQRIRNLMNCPSTTARVTGFSVVLLTVLCAVMLIVGIVWFNTTSKDAGKLPQKLKFSDVVKLPQTDPKVTRFQVAIEADTQLRNIPSSDVKLHTYFFENINGQFQPFINDVMVYFTKDPVNWSGDGKETLIAELKNVEKPNADYHGYILRVYYRGVLQDEVSSPRELSTHFPHQPKNINSPSSVDEVAWIGKLNEALQIPLVSAGPSSQLAPTGKCVKCRELTPKRHPYDQSTAIRLQNAMPAWPSPQNPYDPNSASNTITINFVTPLQYNLHTPI